MLPLLEYCVCVCSFWPWNYDLQRLGIRNLLRTTPGFSVLLDSERNQSSTANGLYVHADVLHLHEFKSQYINSHILFMKETELVSIICDELFFQLNIHRFKVIARFGLMHVMATNICVWIRTLVLESLKEITDFHIKNPQGISGEAVFGSKFN